MGFLLMDNLWTLALFLAQTLKDLCHKGLVREWDTVKILAVQFLVLSLQKRSISFTDFKDYWLATMYAVFIQDHAVHLWKALMFLLRHTTIEVATYLGSTIPLKNAVLLCKMIILRLHWFLSVCSSTDYLSKVKQTLHVFKSF